MPSTSTGPAPAPIPPKSVGHRIRRRSGEPCGRLQRAVPERQASGERGRMRASEPWEAPPGWRGPSTSSSCSSSKRSAPSSVVARHHCGIRAERADGAHQLLRRGLVTEAGQLPRLGDVRSGDGGARQDPLDQRPLRLRLQQDRAALRHHHGIDHHWAPSTRSSLGDGLDGGLVEEHPDLHRVDAHVGRNGRTWSRMNWRGSVSTETTSCVSGR